MCPACLAATGLYVAGGLSAGALTTLLTGRWLGRRSMPEPTHPTEPDEDHEHDEPDDRIET